MRSLLAVSALVLAACASSAAQTPPASSRGAWFGLAEPGSMKSPAIAPTREKRAGIPPPALPAGGVDDPDFAGSRIRSAVETVVGFSQKMRAEGNQMYGRIAGFPSQTRTAEWVSDEFRRAGLHDVEVQTYKGTGDFWWPKSWEVRVVADAASGGGKDIVLASAVPVSRSAIAGGVLSAPVVFTGDAGAVSTAGVSGKIAIQHTKPTTGAYSDRAKVRDSAAALIKAGAVAVINWIEQDGNMHVYDFGQCGGPCFNIGGADGAFLTKAIAAAKASGKPEVKLSLKLEHEVKTGLSASNTIGLVQGMSSDEIIIVNAHLDGWFDGAGDNADGVGVLVALARHFSRRGNWPARSLLFVGSGGHHSQGLNGPASVVTMNPELMKKVVAVVNLEHLAQFEIATAPWDVHVTEEPKNFGVSNSSPFLVAAVKDTAAKYGFVIRPEVTNSVPGDLGGYAPLNVVRMQGIHSGPLYHTSGDVLGSISNEGLTRAARFYADLIRQMAKADAKQLNP